MKKTVTILWSGGWDGSFRFLQLCQFDITIQPIYIIDKPRKSTDNEIQAMKTIIEMASDRFKADIRDIIFYDKEDILSRYSNDTISKAFRNLRKKYHIGTQYEWFALLCNALNMDMETSVVHQYHGKVEDAIEAEGALTTLKDDILGDRKVTDASKSSSDITSVFGRLIFPVIELTKKDEERIARENGWLDILEHSWFCHIPINGKPCGFCGPCEDAMNTGMEWRMPPEAIKRYKHKTLYRTTYKIARKIVRIFT